ncbi:5'/3'-nucleotidase SurE [Guggenheimella bovis]
MNILVVNDDGIKADGIKILAEVAKNFGTVYVVAPKSQQSAVSMGLTIHEPLEIDRAEPLSPDTFAWDISGKPADCVKVAREYLRLPIDLVLSGVNDGPNLGTDILYSGTVAAATEAVIYDIPAIAFSTDFGHFDIAKNLLSETLEYILEKKLSSPGIVLNVNFPLREFNHSKGIKITTQGTRLFSAKFRHENGMYWSEGSLLTTENDENTDVFACSNGYTSITPLGFDRTDYKEVEALKERIKG